MTSPDKLQQACAGTAAADADPMPEPPIEPALEECCGSGCDPCVFDRYDLERAAWRDALKAWKARHPEHAADAAKG